MTARASGLLALASCLLVAWTPSVFAQHFVWVDEDGVTHLTNDPGAAPEDLRAAGGSDWDRTRALWDRWILGERTGTPEGAGGSDADRVTRLLRGAEGDLRRGETSRAAATLKSVVALQPTRARSYTSSISLQRPPT